MNKNTDTLPTVDDIINSFTSFTDFRSKNKDTKKSDTDADTKKKDAKTTDESCKENSNVFRYRNLVEDSISGYDPSAFDYGEYYGPDPIPDDEIWFVVVTEGIVDYVKDWVLDKKASEETLPFNVDKYLEEHKKELGEYNDCLYIDTSSIDTIENGISSVVDVNDWSYEQADKDYNEIAKLNPRAKLYLMGFTNRYDGTWKPVE